MKIFKKISIIGLVLVFVFCFKLKVDGQTEKSSTVSNSNLVVVKPIPYNKALRNPLKGFTTRGIYNHKWATLAQTYIKWNEIENDESDGIDKIRRVTDERWSDIASRNIKVIPRVYLHWDDDVKYWPADMKPDDYTSEQFQQRVVRLIERLGILWDEDPRVAFIELGIFGKWGEQEKPLATKEIQKLVADAVAKSFKTKLVSVRRNWETFTSQPFGEYWDSWAHYDQVCSHGRSIAQLNAEEDRYLKNYVGGEVAYNWGKYYIQPGPSPTANLEEEIHRNFMINSIRWLHCTQLRWIDDYDTTDAEAIAGAEAIQKVFGYRYILEKVAFSSSIENDSLRVTLNVKNIGSAPFYYDWPLEVALLDPDDRSVVWKKEFKNVDIRNWLPGDGWTPPECLPASEGATFYPNMNWVNGTPEWTTPPKTYTVSGDFEINIPDGKYIIALAILDPAGQKPSLRFATSQYFNGGRHPVGIIAVNQVGGGLLPEDTKFDDPADDNSLHYIQ